MEKLRQIAGEIIRREGGFVDDPDDPGGATKHGVTIHTLRRLGLDLDGDGDVDRSDVGMVSASLAEDILLREYFVSPRIAELPEPLWATVFDMQVNAGAYAVRILQKLLNKMDFPCVIDGMIGPETLKAVRAAFAAAKGVMVDAYGIERRNYYFALADRRPKMRKYCRTRAGEKGGWIRRSEAFISPRYHLSAREFSERISSWG